MATDAYRDMMDCIAKWQDAKSLALAHEVWDPTPYVIIVRTGSVGSDTEQSMIDWCVDKLGKESSPIHGQRGRWYRGGAVVFGESTMGFASQEDMALFCTAFQACVI